MYKLLSILLLMVVCLGHSGDFNTKSGDDPPNVEEEKQVLACYNCHSTGHNLAPFDKVKCQAKGEIRQVIASATVPNTGTLPTLEILDYYSRYGLAFRTQHLPGAATIHKELTTLSNHSRLDLPIEVGWQS